MPQMQQQGFKKETTTTQFKQVQQQSSHTGMQQTQTMQRTQQSQQYSNGFTSIEEVIKNKIILNFITFIINIYQ